MLYEIANSGETLYVKVDQANCCASFYRKNLSGFLDELTYISFAAGDPKYAHTLCDAYLSFVTLPPYGGRSTFYPFKQMTGKCGEEPQLGVRVYDNWKKTAFLAIKIRCSCVDVVAPWQVLLHYTPVNADISKADIPK